MVRQHKALSLRRVRYWLLLVLLGTLANMTIIDLPFVVPFSIGNVALFLIWRRLGLFWLVPAAGLVLLPLWQNLALSASVLQLLVLLCFNQRIRQYSVAAIALYAVSCGSLYSLIAPDKIVSEPLYLLLYSGLSTAVFAFCLRTMLILDSLTPSAIHQQQQSLTELLSHRVAMYSSIPSTLLIALVLHGATALDLSHYLRRYGDEQSQLAKQISQRLTGYLTQVVLAGKMLDIVSPAALLPALTAQRAEFSSALVTDAQGKVQHFYKANLPETAKPGSSVADRSYFTEPRRTGLPYISDTFLGRNLGQDQLFAVSTPLTDATNAFSGVLEVSVDLSELTRAISPTDLDISHRVLLDHQQKKIWGTADERPLGQIWSVSSQSDPDQRKYLRYSWFNSFGPITLTQNAAHLLLNHDVAPGQWQLKYFIDTDSFIQRYHLFLAISMLAAMLLLETITALSRAFVSRYTTALEQLARNASSWQPDDPPQPRPLFHQSATEIDTLAVTINDMQHRVRASRRGLYQSMQQIVTLNNELEQRVSHRTEELQHERDRATQLAAIKTRFLANMSHEIRTPITVIKGFSEQLMAKTSGAEAALVSRIQQNTEHLQRLVDDILDTAKIDEGKMSLELHSVPLAAFIQSVIDNVGTLASQKGLTLDVLNHTPAGLHLTADPFRLRQILLNLLSNAIKFTAQGQIRLEISQQTDNQLKISVIDQGIGISPAQLPQLFKAFAQADSSTSRHFGGSGLGLYISQQLAEAMQMTIGVNSNIGQGSEFSLLIPAHLLSYAETTSPTEPVVSVPTISLQPAHILVVDDVADIRALIASYLELQPLQLSFAADGLAAVAQCQQQAFDLIIMDQQMPELDGFSAARQIRDQGYVGPILSLSADVFEDADKQLSALFNLTMTKPFSKQQLLQAIARLQAGEGKLVVSSQPDTGQQSEPTAPPEDELLLEYRQTLPEYAGRIRQLAAANDQQALRRLLHQIKGTSACFGLMEVSALALQAEQLLKNTGAATDSLGQLIKVLQQAELN
ncbi:ATP-binding protein [Rheinheimera sp. F8]|uniref:ATP-binding protein n=1 Tax=Rheinheimera sp. F8 TaxID=1763998 RepID=UPI000AF9C464|nr:ATP-binding protein [Rheinheimera sp. F8]